MDPRKLCHISDLPNNLHFLPIQIKHLLPVHHPKFADNLHTIVANQAYNSQWNVYPDFTLTLSNPCYLALSGGWCEDIDGKEQHLKSSLELSAIVLNYISSLFEAPTEDQEYSSSQAIHRADHIGFDPSPSQLSFPLTIAYNIYKTKDKDAKNRFIFIVGYHRTSHLRLYSLLSTIREWNFHRFKSDSCRDIRPDRAHKNLEHLIVILRGFLPLQEEDHLGKQRQLQLLVQQIDPQSIPKEIPKDGIDDTHQVVLSRFEWTYKNNITQRDLTIFSAEVLTELLKIMPINSASSYAGKSCYEPKMNQFTLLWMTAFKKNKSHLLPTEDAFETMAKQATSFLRRKTVEQIKDSSTNIADEMLRSSLQVLNRYAPGDQRTNVDDWGNQSQVSRGRQNSYNRSVKDSVVSQKPRNHDFDRMSIISRVSFKDTLSDSNRKKVNAQFQSLTSPLMAHRDRQYSQLLGTITKWQSLNGPIPSWPDLQSKIRRNCQTAKQRYSSSLLNRNESRLLLALVALRKYLELDEFFLMIKYHSEHRQALYEVLFQGSAGSFLQELGTKLAHEFAKPLYDAYITKAFRIDRANPLPSFLKKMVDLFAPETQMKEIGEKISVPLLLQLLESKNVGSENYRLLARGSIPDVFVPNKAMMVVSPILCQIYLTLAEDHHEELVNGMIGDLAFESVYFSHDQGNINNSPYRRPADLRHKKLLEVLREGGFNTLGYQISATLKPIIFEFKNYSLPSSRVYEEIIITRPLQLARFVELIASSTFLQHLPDVTAHFRDLQPIADRVTRPISNAYLQSEVGGYKWQPEADIGEGVLKSESGIFRHLFEYNPNLKLAGRPLGQVLKARESDRPVPLQRFEAEYILSCLFNENLSEIYQFILIIWNIKQKYEQYDCLTEDEKIYLRQIVHQVLCRKSDILEYLDLAFLAKQFTETQSPFLF